MFAGDRRLSKVIYAEATCVRADGMLQLRDPEPHTLQSFKRARATHRFG